MHIIYKDSVRTLQRKGCWHCKEESINAVQESNQCSLWESFETQSTPCWKRAEILLLSQAVHTNHQALNGYTPLQFLPLSLGFVPVYFTLDLW